MIINIMSENVANEWKRHHLVAQISKTKLQVPKEDANGGNGGAHLLHQ